MQVRSRPPPVHGIELSGHGHITPYIMEGPLKEAVDPPFKLSYFPDTHAARTSKLFHLVNGYGVNADRTDRGATIGG